MLFRSSRACNIADFVSDRVELKNSSIPCKSATQTYVSHFHCVYYFAVYSFVQYARNVAIELIPKTTLPHFRRSHWIFHRTTNLTDSAHTINLIYQNVLPNIHSSTDTHMKLHKSIIFLFRFKMC